MKINMYIVILPLILAFQNSLGLLFDEHPRIYKGELAEANQFPYMVAIFTGNWCSGSVISINTVLTARHCLVNNSVVVPVENISIIYATLNSKKGPIVGARKILFPPEKPIKGDIALILTKEPFPDCVATAALPPQCANYASGTDVFQIGWGITAPDKRPHNFLRFAKLRMGVSSWCFLDHDGLHLTRICIEKVNGSTVCPGDSGGPTVIRSKDGVHMIVGVSSYSLEVCFEHNYRGFVASKVSFYTNWILENGEGPFKVIG